MGIYEAPRWHRVLPWVGTVVGSPLVAVAVVLGPWPAWSALGIVPIVAVNFYVDIYRSANRVVLTPMALQWRTGVRAGQVGLVDIIAVRPARLDPSRMVIDHRGGSLLLLSGRGLQEFLAALAAAHPSINFSSLPERLRLNPYYLIGRSWWHPKDPVDLV